MEKTRLWILPNFLGEESVAFFPKIFSEVLLSLDGLVAESEKKARQLLSAFLPSEDWKKIPLYLLNEHTSSFQKYIRLLLANKTLGLIADAGLPCLADPGCSFIFSAQEKKIPLQVLPGYSSIFLGLILSGFNANRFYFHGYLSRENPQCIKELKHMETRSSTEDVTQIWIETPYRVNRMLDLCLKSLHPKTYLCLAQDLLLSKQKVKIQTIDSWRKNFSPLPKGPCVFLLRTKL